MKTFGCVLIAVFVVAAAHPAAADEAARFACGVGVAGGGGYRAVAVVGRGLGGAPSALTLYNVGGQHLANDTDGDEIFDIFDPDNENDLLIDRWEIAFFGDLAAGAGEDPDYDGVSNLGEQAAGTWPTLPDTEFDGMPDGWEIAYGTNPLAPDAAADPDGNGLSNLQEFFKAFTDQQAAIDAMYTQAEVDALLEAWDVDSDGQIGLSEAIRALQITSNVRTESSTTTTVTTTSSTATTSSVTTTVPPTTTTVITTSGITTTLPSSAATTVSPTTTTVTTTSPTTSILTTTSTSSVVTTTVYP